jgi:hypothetical protein
MDEDVLVIEENKPLPILIKRKINDFSSFCTNIKNKIKSTTEFTCKSTINALKLETEKIVFSLNYKIFKRKNIVDFYTYQLKIKKAYCVVT